MRWRGRQYVTREAAGFKPSLSMIYTRVRCVAVQPIAPEFLIKFEASRDLKGEEHGC
jgi:hypothetical protein